MAFPIYRLEAGWYYGDLGLPILSDGSVCIDAFRWLHRTKYIQFFETIKSIELPHPDNTKITEIIQKKTVLYSMGVMCIIILLWIA